VRDIDVRSALVRYLVETRLGDQDPLVIHELALCQGVSRIDVAVVDDSLSGYEIKSAYDTLERLPNQIQTYERSLEFVTLVCSSRHIKRAQKIIPAWWGIMEARPADSIPLQVDLKPYRENRSNPNIDSYAVAQLLWREEALEALDSLDLSKGLRSKPRRYLWQRLADTLTVEDLSEIVRAALKSRSGWRAAPQLQLHGG
jgi:hypothetical protein